jgi:ABC-type uncharacterized transport system permease subunit
VPRAVHPGRHCGQRRGADGRQNHRRLDRVAALLLAGVLGGMAWAGLTALLRDKFNANEILVSLMLVYVAVQVLGYLVFGPVERPAGLQLSANQDLRGGDAHSAPV